MTRVLGPRDTIGAGYLWRALTPLQTAAIAEARAHGVAARALAAEYGVSVRTIYRALTHAGQRVVVVEVEHWRAEFVITDDGPVRMTAWHANGAS